MNTTQTPEAATQKPQSREETRTLRNYVGGEWKAAQATDVLDNRNPATGDVLARCRSPGRSTSRRRFARPGAQPAWRPSPPSAAPGVSPARGADLTPRRARPAGHRGHGQDDHRRPGRGRPRDRVGGVGSAIPHLMKGENLVGVARGVDIEQVRQPVGVVAAITPFNFPAMIPLWFLPTRSRGQRVHPQALRARPTPGRADLRADRRDDEIPPGSATSSTVAGGGQTAALHPGVDASRSSARPRPRGCRSARCHGQAVPGARRREELTRRDARREPRETVPAIMGSAFGAAGQRCLAGSVAVLVGDGRARTRSETHWSRRPSSCGSGPAPRRRPTSVRWSAPTPASATAARERAAAADAEVVLDGRDGRPGPAGTMLGPTIVEARTTTPTRPRGALRPGARAVMGAEDLDRRPQVRQRVSIRQLGIDLHHLGQRGEGVPLRGRGGDDRRQHRGRRADRMVPVLRVEGLHGRATSMPTGGMRSSSTLARRSSPRWR